MEVGIRRVGLAEGSRQQEVMDKMGQLQERVRKRRS